MKNKTKNITEEKLKQKYLIENKSMNEVCLLYNISRTTLKRLLKKFNLHKSADKSLEIRKNTNRKKFGVDYCLQNQLCKEKAKNTCKKKYGTDNAMQSNLIQQRLQKALLEKYGEINVFKVDEIKDKIKHSCLTKYGEDNFAKTCEFKEKCHITKTKNKSFNISQPEENFYKLLVDRFGNLDVERQYNTLVEEHNNRYPFDCDFYIRSLDLFIELNLSWTHGEHSFNPNNKEDITKLADLKNKAMYSKYYRNAINVWTVRDPLKLKVAKENNLNYLVFYTEREAISWINHIKAN